MESPEKRSIIKEVTARTKEATTTIITAAIAVGILIIFGAKSERLKQLTKVVFSGKE